MTLTIATRQKADKLFFLNDESLGEIALPFVSDIRKISGYSAISLLVISDVPFTVTVRESCEEDGANDAQTQSFASAVDASTGLNFIAQRFTPCASFATFTITFTGTPASVSACGLGLPQSGGGGGSGPATPQVVAADVVVDPAGLRSDVTTIAAAIAALPAEGGTIFMHAGNYSVDATLVLPNKPIAFIGSGVKSTTIDIGSNAIALFSIGAVTFPTRYVFQDFLVTGDAAVASQRVWATTGASGATISVVRVDTDATITVIVDTTANSNGISFADFQDCSLLQPNIAASRFWSGSGGVETVHCYDVDARTGSTGSGFNGGGITGVVNLRAYSSRFQIAGGGCDLRSGELFGCEFARGTITLGSGSSATSFVIGCLFNSGGGTPTRWLDVLVNGSCLVADNLFGAFSSEAIRTANQGSIYENNRNCRVLETGSANGNQYNGNTGFDSSTIIGTTSTVDHQNVRAFTNGSHTLDLTHRTVTGDATLGNVTFNLPAAANARYHVYRIKRLDGSANTLTIDPSGGELIDGAATRTINVQFESLDIQCDGTGWIIL